MCIHSTGFCRIGAFFFLPLFAEISVLWCTGFFDAQKTKNMVSSARKDEGEVF
jgi:hypothetical protein